MENLSNIKEDQIEVVEDIKKEDIKKEEEQIDEEQIDEEQIDEVVEDIKKEGEEQIEEEGEEGEEVEDIEEKEEEESMEEKFMKEIKKVQNDVSIIKQKIERFEKKSEKLFEEISSTKEAEKFEKECLCYSESLLKFLFSLDTLVGSESIRPMRKELVVNIQTLLDRVDNVSKKLKTILEKVREQEKMNEKTEEEKEDEIKEGDDEEEIEEVDDEEEFDDIGMVDNDEKDSNKIKKEDRSKYEKLDNMIKKFTLNPTFKVVNSSNNFIIKSYIPNIELEDVSVGYKNNVLTIKGHKLPTEKEYAILLSKVEEYKQRAARRNNSYNHFFFSPQPRYSEIEILQQLVRGNFGSFEKQYTLSSNEYSVEAIEADYNNDVLEIIVKTSVPQIKKVSKNPSRKNDYFDNRIYHDYYHQPTYSNSNRRYNRRGNSPYNFGSMNNFFSNF